MVGIADIPCDAEHLFKREHQFNRRAQFRSLDRRTAVQVFISSEHALRLSVQQSHVFETLVYGVKVFFIRVLLIIYYRFLESLGQIDAMD